MTFQYGSNDPQIKNPFKREGLLYLASGTIILLLGVLSLFALRNQMVETGQAAGWMNLVICLILLAGGVAYVTKGLMQIFRFYVGRGIPSSISRNVARSEKHVFEANLVYQPEELDQMLTGRKNITFREPSTLLDRMIYSIFPKMIFLPYSMRNFMHVLIQNTGYSLIALLFYWLALLSGSLGLTQLSQSSFSSWLGIGLSVGLLLLWLFNKLSAKHTNSFRLLGSKGSIVWVIVLSILVPAAGELAIRQGIEFPDAPFHPVLHLIALYLIIPLLAAASIVLAKFRSELYEPMTEISEFREHWQENVHPKDFFRSLDMELANLRYKEFPNRVYRELSPNLNMEGSMDKGSFVGDTIQETQPVYEEIAYPPLFQQLRLYIAIAGHVLVVLSAVLLFFLNRQYIDGLVWSRLFDGIYFPLLLWIFGSAAQTLAHLYWAEMHFTSYLIHFQGEGTYTESKLSVGMAITDSTRSENTVVRTSFSPWLLVTRLVTSTQASSGSGNLAGPRFVTSMHKADDLLDHLVGKIRRYLGEREIIATTVSNKDLQSIQTLYAFNEAAPSKQAATNLEGPELKKSISRSGDTDQDGRKDEDGEK
ncbi:hypothetical protein OB236_18885 [Paenibacillus sp. WQ 127069]|uniref:PH domain-containing protein n=1 Tax=Paenibacillus baimaensis TaxID=2982185 RepID=A0ABT2UHR9_9BACL|nr:hypothetical protein [Paenibacillus sp. WQ 127069]MCU6794174.1 hypothetical protein [Paenibacillus sp. WQ 127069]